MEVKKIKKVIESTLNKNKANNVVSIDLKKKSCLLEKLVDLDSQIWITATENEKFFQNKKNFCYHHLTENGLQNVY